MTTFVIKGPAFPHELLQAHEDHGNYFDRALHQLEKKLTNPAVMRRKAIEILSTPSTAPDLDIHRALLDLARTKDGGIQLVTTNFDRRFEDAYPDNTLKQVAPCLGPPRPGAWRHLTYLHGLIQDDDPDGKHLVMTSGDFGRAYLKDGWAARFVVELFREYTVLFVGYSLNDPIVGYLIDALAADMGDDKQIRKAYVLAGHKNSAKACQEAYAEWRSKEVIPILFPIMKRTTNPFHLHDNSLRKWALQYRGGVNSRINLAQTIGTRPYQSGDQDGLANLARALSQPDGLVARAFADAKPVPDISWLDPLSRHAVPTRPNWATVGLFDLPSPPTDGVGFHPGPCRPRCRLSVGACPGKGNRATWGMA